MFGNNDMCAAHLVQLHNYVKECKYNYEAILDIAGVDYQKIDFIFWVWLLCVYNVATIPKNAYFYIFDIKKAPISRGF